MTEERIPEGVPFTEGAYHCPRCIDDGIFEELTYEAGDPGNETGLPENCWPAEDEYFYCDVCEATFGAINGTDTPEDIFPHGQF